MHPYSTKSHCVKYAALLQYCHVSSFSTVIVNHFIGEGDFLLSQHSMDGYEAMLFDVTQSTQDEEQSLFTIKTNMPIPMMVVYGDSFQWVKYGHPILPSNLDLKSNNKAGLHQTFWNCLIEFLCTDLDGNLSSTLIPLTTSKLDHYLSKKYEVLSETANRGNSFDEHMLNEKASIASLMRWLTLHCLQHRFPYPHSQIYSTRGLKSIQCWNQRLKY
jgi:hypothetical protein